MGFFGNLISTTIKTALTPIAVVKDVVNISIGEDPDATKNHIESTLDDLGDAIDDLADGEL